VNKLLIVCSTGLCLAVGSVAVLRAQDAGRGGPQGQEGPPGPGGGGFGGPRGGGGPMGEETKLVKQFDKDGDGRLNRDERQAARDFVKKERASGRMRSGPGGPGGFGPGTMLAQQMLSQGDKDNDQKLTRAEFTALADAWFDKLDPDKSGKLSQDQFAEHVAELLPRPQGFGGPGGGGPGGGGPGGGGFGGGRGGFGPGRFIGPGLFTRPMRIRTTHSRATSGSRHLRNGSTSGTRTRVAA